MLNILFMGTPDFAKESLEEILNAGYNITGVVTNPDRQKGRGMKKNFSPVKEYAISKKLNIYQPERIKGNEEFISEIKKINPDIICVVAYGKILPKEILEIPKLGCINLHGSILPKYRGAAPIQWAVINGDSVTGVTTIYMNEKMDEGDIILEEKVNIDINETMGELWNKLSNIGAKLLVKTIKQIETHKATRTKQGKNFSVAPMLDKSIAKINWETKTSLDIKNLVRGLNPIMGAYSILNGKKLKIWKVDNMSVSDFIKKYEEFKDYEYRFDGIDKGTILYIDKKQGVYVKALDGIVLIEEVQAENSKKMNITDFILGNKIEVADKFEN